MKIIITILRIISNVATLPAIFFFFYYMILAIGQRSRGESAAFYFILPFIIFLIPLAIHFIAKYLDGRK